MWPLANEELNFISCQQRSVIMGCAQSWLRYRPCTLGTSLWRNTLNMVFGTHKLKVGTSCDDLKYLLSSELMIPPWVSNCGQCGHRSANRFGAQHPIKQHGLLQTLWAENRTLFIGCPLSFLCSHTFVRVEVFPQDSWLWTWVDAR